MENLQTDEDEVEYLAENGRNQVWERLSLKQIESGEISPPIMFDLRKLENGTMKSLFFNTGTHGIILAENRDFFQLKNLSEHDAEWIIEGERPGYGICAGQLYLDKNRQVDLFFIFYNPDNFSIKELLDLVRGVMKRLPVEIFPDKFNLKVFERGSFSGHRLYTLVKHADGRYLAHKIEDTRKKKNED